MHNNKFLKHLSTTVNKKSQSQSYVRLETLVVLVGGLMLLHSSCQFVDVWLNAQQLHTDIWFDSFSP